MPDSTLRDHSISRRPQRWSLGLLLLLSSLCLAAQPAPQLPRDSNTDQNAPNTKAVHDQMSSKDVVEKLSKALDSKNAAYAGSRIEAAADDQTVTLSGTVTSSMQHEMALQLARAYAGNRRIVDKLTIQP